MSVYGAFAIAPGPGNAVTVGVTSTAAIDLGEYTLCVVISLDQPAHLRFGEANVNAATTTDVRFAAGTYVLSVTPGRRFLRAIRATATDAALTWGVGS